MFARSIALAAAAVALGAAAYNSTASTKYISTMTAGEETPPTGVAATGTATFTLDGSKIEFAVNVKGLSGPATAAHIHVGARGVAGPPVYTFIIKPVANGEVAKGTIDLKTPATAGVSGDSLKVLLNNGNAYVNVHTALNGKGEIRGQVVKK